ncbi:hypothetical protein MTO96_037370 [Rhipicephalus appendiculatus]
MGPFTLALWLLAAALAAASQGDGSFFAAKLKKRIHFSEEDVCSEALQRKVRWAGRRFTRRLSVAGQWEFRVDNVRERRRKVSRLLSAGLLMPGVDHMHIDHCSMQMEIASIFVGVAKSPAEIFRVRAVAKPMSVAVRQKLILERQYWPKFMLKCLSSEHS